MAGNSYFSFKGFTIHQEHCAMKVCTDSALFGAWVASLLSGNKSARIADVGTGTGLLSLMIAQKTNVFIDAIEIDRAAAAQALENIKLSGFSNISIHERNVFDINSNRYDHIVCNPPFFELQLQSPENIINKARHETSFDLNSFAQWCNEVLTSRGELFVLLPATRSVFFKNVCLEQKLFCTREMTVYTKEGGKHIRTMQSFSKIQMETHTASICIKDSTNNYTPEFRDLLKDYYLQF